MAGTVNPIHDWTHPCRRPGAHISKVRVRRVCGQGNVVPGSIEHTTYIRRHQRKAGYYVAGILRTQKVCRCEHDIPCLRVRELPDRERPKGSSWSTRRYGKFEIVIGLEVYDAGSRKGGGPSLAIVRANVNALPSYGCIKSAWIVGIGHNVFGLAGQDVLKGVAAVPTVINAILRIELGLRGGDQDDLSAVAGT